MCCRGPNRKSADGRWLRRSGADCGERIRHATRGAGRQPHLRRVTQWSAETQRRSGCRPFSGRSAGPPTLELVGRQGVVDHPPWRYSNIMTSIRKWLIAGCVCGCLPMVGYAAALGGRQDTSREAAARLVADVVRADYDGDRTKLAALRERFVMPANDPRLSSLVHYWRGFAMWRRAINGFNDDAPPDELARDLQTAVDDFQAALRMRPGFVDAKVGLISAIGYQGYLRRSDADATLPSLVRLLGTTVEALVDAPDHPRLLWVLGPSLWFAPPGTSDGLVEDRQARAIRAYERALKVVRATEQRAALDPLEPRWGEPELLMSLAWSNLHRASPNAALAEKQARAALALVPNWHYVRDILLPQIQQARRSDGRSPRSGRRVHN